MDHRGGGEQAKQNGHGGCDGGDDVSEWKKVAELRAVVQAQDPAAKPERSSQPEAFPFPAIKSSHLRLGRSQEQEQPTNHPPKAGGQRRPSGMDRGGEERTKRNGHGGCDGGGDDDVSEWKKVAELRAVVEAEDPASKEEDDFMLRRFLRARDHNIRKASAMFLKYLAWKRAAKPNGSITEDEVRNELMQEKLYVQGHDKMGRPMVYLFGARHFTAKRDLDEFKRYVVYILDNTCTKLPAGQEKFASVVDLKGFGYANSDIRAMLAALDIMQNNYPERLGRVFLIHVPYVFMAAWKIVYPFIDDTTKKKFVFVADRDLDATLREAIDECQLPKEFGGKLKLQGYNSSSP